MGKPLVRFCEGPGINEGQEVRGTRHVVVACDEAFHESLVEHLISDHLKTSVYSKIMVNLNHISRPLVRRGGLARVTE
jgi:hypothetical protein